MSKTQLRKRMAEIVSTLKSEEKQAQSKVIFKKLINHPRYKDSKKISIFLSTKNEVDTIPILQHAIDIDHKQCFIPLVRKTTFRRDDTAQTRMIMYELTSMKEYEDLPTNNYGIKEPVESVNTSRIATPCSKDCLDLVIVPGVAFSKDGRRLGHGKGYYDEFLVKWSETAHKSLYCIGLAFKQQLVDDPMSVEGQDYVLDEVLTA